jgi:hypothetical protein
MLDHVLSTWGAVDAKVAAAHRVFARDGWRCTVPGCTSMQNLHDHHIRFRSAGGSNDLDNRSTVCAAHHLRGIHAGLVRCSGQAPDGLHWELGIRPGAEPLLAYRSGDVRIPDSADASQPAVAHWPAAMPALAAVSTAASLPRRLGGHPPWPGDAQRLGRCLGLRSPEHPRA